MCRAGVAAGLAVDDFAPRLSFFFAIGMNYFMEVAKLRAARLLWSELMQTHLPHQPEILMLRHICQTSDGRSRRRMCSIMWRAHALRLQRRSCWPHAIIAYQFLDEALGLPTDYAARIARNTQLHLQSEGNMAHVIDPFGGSYLVEKLTNELVTKARDILPSRVTWRNGRGD